MHSMSFRPSIELKFYHTNSFLLYLAITLKISPMETIMRNLWPYCTHNTWSSLIGLVAQCMYAALLWINLLLYRNWKNINTSKMTFLCLIGYSCFKACENNDMDEKGIAVVVNFVEWLSMLLWKIIIESLKLQSVVFTEYLFDICVQPVGYQQTYSLLRFNIAEKTYKT